MNNNELASVLSRKFGITVIIECQRMKIGEKWITLTTNKISRLNAEKIVSYYAERIRSTDSN